VRRFAIGIILCAVAARVAWTQAAPPGAAAKRAAQNAASATNTHIANEQRTSDVSAPTAPRPSAAAASAQPAAQQPVQRVAAKPASNGASAAAKAGTRPQGQSLTVAMPSDTTLPPMMIMREQYEYARNGRRDPFYSLLMTSELRPTMSDLRLTTIIYDATGRHSLAVLRDIGTNEQYRVATGAILGRMRVSSIRPRVIVFTIDEFGTNRQDSLVLSDSIKARVR